MSELPSGEILDLIRGQTRLETKLDAFISTQARQDTDISALKSDVTEINGKLAGYKSTLQGALAIFGIIWTVVTLFLVPFAQKKLGI
ncbi:hypothetical protein ACCS79_03540 [Rhizobium johnstonii]|uniref:hypothetical protein n=1 Tax=Rhizobium johnstonii TaxID=3019933 RepID=UPI003F98EE09